MIKLIDDWYIDADDMQYKLGKAVTRVNAKTGEKKTELTKTTYHSTLAGAVRAAYSRYSRELVQRDTWTLERAVEALTALQNKFEIILLETIGKIERVKHKEGA